MDTTKVEQDILAEKLKEKEAKATTLEEELAKYKAKEEEQKVAEEKAKEEANENRIKALEEREEQLKVDFEEKLSKISQRATTANSGESEGVITFEEYKALPSEEREKYDTAALKESLDGRGVFND